ncbi:hypothetical protein OQA88_13384 [Cercophora sp. LCS_1]
MYPQTPPEYSNIARRPPLLSTWALEIGGLTLSIAATVAAAVVLWLYDGHPLEKWGFFALSLNTVISALGVVSRASLAFVLSSAIGQHKWNWFRKQHDGLGVFNKFDGASRGPWGSLGLLWWSKALNWASLGAFVTIITLLVDPFLQATVSLSGQSVVVGTANTVQVADYVHLGKQTRTRGGVLSLTVEEGSLKVDQITVFPDFALTSAFADGLSPRSLSGAPGAATARAECSTGNCTWPLYTTAALCGRCNDVSQSDITRHTGEGFREATDYSPPDGSFFGSNNFTSYNLSYGHIMHFNGPITTNYSPFKPVRLTAFMNHNHRTSISFRDLNTTVATLLIMRAGADYENNGANWEDSLPTATECGLYVCAKAYRAMTINGIFNETEVGTWAIKDSRSWRTAEHEAHPHLPDDTSWESYDRQNTSLGDDLFYRTDLQVVIPAAELPQPVSESIPLVFNITQATIQGMREAMSGLFEASQVAASLTRDAFVPVKPYLVYPNNNDEFRNDVPDILYNSTNLTTTFEGLARRLSVQFRDSAAAVSNGTEERFVLHFKVDWRFFLLLVITVLLGCVYFAGVLVQTYRLRLPSWKESSYPTLAYGLDDYTQSQLRVLQEASYKSRDAVRQRDGFQVGLVNTDNGYRLVSQQGGHDATEIIMRK